MRLAIATLVISICVVSCHVRDNRGVPDPSIKRVKVGSSELAVKEDLSWLDHPDSGLIGFRIRISYAERKAFTVQENSLLNFGIEDNFSLACGGDTVTPVFFQRVADGAADHMEYLAAFEPGKEQDNRPVVRKMAASTRLVLLFRDPLFGLGSQAIHF